MSDKNLFLKMWIMCFADMQFQSLENYQCLIPKKKKERSCRFVDQLLKSVGDVNSSRAKWRTVMKYTLHMTYDRSMSYTTYDIWCMSYVVCSKYVICWHMLEIYDTGFVNAEWKHYSIMLELTSNKNESFGLTELGI